MSSTKTHVIFAAYWMTSRDIPSHNKTPNIALNLTLCIFEMYVGRNWSGREFILRNKSSVYGKVSNCLCVLIY